jgi:ADP-ribosylglycohydrolase
MGLCIGDALGVPFEFKSRDELSENPVIDMTGYGTYNLKAGAWSDDTSLNLCLMDSLIKELNYYDILSKFQRWYKNGEYSATDICFDIGNTTRFAIENFENKVEPLMCGGLDAQSNGNGSLMRILPIV